MCQEQNLKGMCQEHLLIVNNEYRISPATESQLHLSETLADSEQWIENLNCMCQEYLW